MIKKLLLIFVTILICGCNSPLTKKFNEETAKEDFKSIKEDIDSTEFNLLVGSMLRLKFQEKTLEDMTYEEILENGKKWKAEQDKIEAEQKALAQKAALEEAGRIERLSKAVTVTCFNKGYTEYDYEDYITYKFVIKNKSEKIIRAIKGEITFTNLFDDEISSLKFVYDQPINTGEEVNWNAQTDYNQFKDEDKSLKNKDLQDLKVIWKPEKIIFEDGTTLE